MKNSRSWSRSGFRDGSTLQLGAFLARWSRWWNRKSNDPTKVWATMEAIWPCSMSLVQQWGYCGSQRPYNGLLWSCFPSLRFNSQTAMDLDCLLIACGCGVWCFRSSLPWWSLSGDASWRPSGRKPKDVQRYFQRCPKSHLWFPIFSSYSVSMFFHMFFLCSYLIFAEISRQSLSIGISRIFLRRSRTLRFHIHDNSGSTVAREDGDSFLLGLWLVDGIANLPECCLHWRRGYPGTVAFIYLSLVHLSRRGLALSRDLPFSTGDITVATCADLFLCCFPKQCGHTWAS